MYRLLFFLGLLVAPLYSQQPIPASFFGLTTIDFNNPRSALLTSGTVRSGDVYSPHINWATINTAPGVYDWSFLDHWVAVARSKHQDIIFILGGTPTWASSEPNAKTHDNAGSSAPPRDISVWTAWVKAVATRYKGKIKYYELWNEPNDPASWISSPELMVPLAQAAHAAIHSIDPAAKLTTPTCTEQSGISWMEKYLAAGGNAYADAFSFHSYNGNPNFASAEEMAGLIQGYAAVAAKHGMSSLPMLSTEGSWGAGATYIKDHSSQADFLVKFFVLHALHGVSCTAWYALDTGPEWGQLEGRDNALNPAGIAYRTVYSWLVGSTITDSAISPDGTYKVTIRRADGKQAMILWNSQKTVRIPVPGMTAIYNVQAIASPVADAAVTVGTSPVLVGQ